MMADEEVGDDFLTVLFGKVLRLLSRRREMPSWKSRAAVVAVGVSAERRVHQGVVLQRRDDAGG